MKKGGDCWVVVGTGNKLGKVDEPVVEEGRAGASDKSFADCGLQASREGRKGEMGMVSTTQEKK